MTISKKAVIYGLVSVFFVIIYANMLFINSRIQTQYPSVTEYRVSQKNTDISENDYINAKDIYNMKRSTEIIISGSYYGYENIYTNEGRHKFATIIYTDAERNALYNINIIKGGSLEFDNPKNNIPLLISKSLCDELFISNDIINTEIHIGNYSCIITGIFENSNDDEYSVYIPYKCIDNENTNKIEIISIASRDRYYFESSLASGIDEKLMHYETIDFNNVISVYGLPVSMLLIGEIIVCIYTYVHICKLCLNKTNAGKIAGIITGTLLFIYILMCGRKIEFPFLILSDNNIFDLKYILNNICEVFRLNNNYLYNVEIFNVYKYLLIIQIFNISVIVFLQIFKFIMLKNMKKARNFIVCDILLNIFLIMIFKTSIIDAYSIIAVLDLLILEMLIVLSIYITNGCSIKTN